MAGKTSDGTIVSKLYRNDGNYQYTEINAGITGVIHGSAAWGDYNNNGYADLLLMGKYVDWDYEYYTIAKIYKNNGDGTFTDINVPLQNMAYGKALWFDYDNDGLLDIILTGYNYVYNFSFGGYFERYTKLYKNMGNDSFIEIPTIMENISGSSLDIGDYNNNGFKDILISGYDGSTKFTKIFRNNGDGTFTDINADLLSVYPGTVLWGDYNSDGLLDVLISGETSQGYATKIYRNDSNDVFTDINANLPGIKYANAVWADYNNDGHLNVIITGELPQGEYSYMYRYDGNDTFTEIPGFIHWLDAVTHGNISHTINFSNRTLDMLLCGRISGGYPGTFIYRNNSGEYSQPFAPSNLNASQKGDNITLTWSKGHSTQTPQNALTYNLYIRTEGNPNNIVASLSSIPQGRRRIVSGGNAFHNTEWTIKDLPDGTYYWSVQTLDNRFIGSSFATEQSFTKITLNAPLNPQITYLASGEVNLIWDEVSNAGSYKVFASDDPSGDFTDVSDEGLFEGLGWTAPGAEIKRFYYVVAVSE